MVKKSTVKPKYSQPIAVKKYQGLTNDKSGQKAKSTKIQVQIKTHSNKCAKKNSSSNKYNVKRKLISNTAFGQTKFGSKKVRVSQNIFLNFLPSASNSNRADKKWRLTFCICDSTGNSLLVPPGGNAEKKFDYEINEKFFRTSPAPNHSCHVAAAEVSMSSPDFCKYIVNYSNTNRIFDNAEMSERFPSSKLKLCLRPPLLKLKIVAAWAQYYSGN